MAQHLLAFLAGHGTDQSGRTVDDVLRFGDALLEQVHDYIQWLFPLPTRSGANPLAPVLHEDELAAIRASPAALANVRRALARMTAFYEAYGGWLVRHDHNHLRITRIVASVRLTLGDDAARRFFDIVMARHEAAGRPVAPTALAFWRDALGARQAPA